VKLELAQFETMGLQVKILAATGPLSNTSSQREMTWKPFRESIPFVHVSS
jgi:hypothetical protein